MTKLEFRECDTCAAKPGTPPLCIGCLNNRAVIATLIANASPTTNVPDPRMSLTLSDMKLPRGRLYFIDDQTKTRVEISHNDDVRL